MITTLDPHRRRFLKMAELLADRDSSVGLQRTTILELENLLKTVKEYTFPKKEEYGPTTCGEADARAEKDYFKKLRLLQAQCNERLPASARQAAFDELQTLMYNDKWKFERAADIERKEAMLARAVSVTELERNIDEFLKDREYYRSRTSMDGLGANLEYDRKLCTVIKNYVRHSLKLPTL